MSALRQELIDTIQEVDHLGSSLTRTFVLSLAHDDMDLDLWERLQDCLKEIHSKANSASLTAATLRRLDNQ